MTNISNKVKIMLIVIKSDNTIDIEHIMQALNITINNIPIKCNSNITFLVLFIDYKLNWKIQFYHMFRKLSRYIAILNKIKYNLNEKSLILVYYDIFKCYLIYFSHIWGNSFESNNKTISKIQN